MKKLFIAIFCMILVVTLVSCNSGEHTHSFADSVVLEARCGSTGLIQHSCEECGFSTTEEIPATGNHSFGSWTLSSATSMYRTCTVCGSIETAPITGANQGNNNGNTNNNGNNGSNDNTGNNSAGNNTGDNGNNSGTTEDMSMYTYTTFSSFEQDCIVNGSNLVYNGQYNKIIVSLSGGNSTSSCENKHLVIPSRVTDIQLVGLASGSPFRNFSIEFEERVNDVNLTMNDVRIESNSTIISSQSRNIQFNMTMLGNTCSFIVTGKGADGANGSDGATNDTNSVFGKDGEHGASAFIINGFVTVYSNANLLQIQGGDGGHGGKGGHILTSSAPSGGDGGNGGNGIAGEELATVYVSSGCNAHINGGVGGKGGAGGSSDAGYWGTNRTGDTGKDGANGISGCRIINN